jgi:hypothetical protein
LEAYTHHLEQESMAVLFPTFTSIWQRAKRLLGTDVSEVLAILKEDAEDFDQPSFNPIF